MISNNDFNKKLRAENNELFYRISSNTSSQIVDQVYKDFKSYEKALSSYIKNPEKFKGKPRFPRLKRHKIDIDTLRTKFNLPTNIKKKNKKYYDKIDEIYAIHGIKLYEYLQVKLDFSSQQVRLCDGQVMLPINFDFIKPFKTKEDWLSTPESKLKCMRIIPSRNKFKVEIIYQLLNSPLNLSSGGLMGIDLGVNNYAACVTTNGDAFLINGRGMKSYNKFYNKNLRKKREKLAKGKAYSRGMAALDEKRHFKFKDFLHHVTKFLVQYVVDNNIRFVVVGANKYWKQGGLSNGKQKAKGRGARNFNQTFQQIPYETFISILGYKLRDIGVQLITTEESYTSKCSFFDNEFPQKHKEYKGKRVKRGLFKTGGGMLINADCNGALNILKKVFGELSLTDFDDSIVRAVAAPKMINFNI
jgi:putative transposase